MQQRQFQQRQQQRQRPEQRRGRRGRDPVTGREPLRGGVRPGRRPGRPAEAALPEHPLLNHALCHPQPPLGRPGREGAEGRPGCSADIQLRPRPLAPGTRAAACLAESGLREPGRGELSRNNAVPSTWEIRFHVLHDAASDPTAAPSRAPGPLSLRPPFLSLGCFPYLPTWPSLLVICLNQREVGETGGTRASPTPPSLLCSPSQCK